MGDYFVDSIMADIESLALFHGIHAKHLGFHRILADRFPFAVYYDNTPAVTYVFAVLDMRKDPLWIRRSLLADKRRFGCADGTKRCPCGPLTVTALPPQRRQDY